jgi:uncharacterized protein (DUF433 family)
MSAKNRMVYRTSYLRIVNVDVDGAWGGEAIIEGARMAVWLIVGYYYKVGMSVEDILAEWDYLNPSQLFSALAYYRDNRREADEARVRNSSERWSIDCRNRRRAIICPLSVALPPPCSAPDSPGGRAP